MVKSLTEKIEKKQKYQGLRYKCPKCDALYSYAKRCENCGIKTVQMLISPRTDMGYRKERIEMYVCGQCGGNLYRDEARIEGVAFIACLMCGNRWPSGVEPIKTDHSSKESKGQVKEDDEVSQIQKDEKGHFLKICNDCGELRKHHGRGLCSKCYSARRTAGTLPPLLISRFLKSARPDDGLPACPSIVLGTRIRVTPAGIH